MLWRSPGRRKCSPKRLVRGRQSRRSLTAYNRTVAHCAPKILWFVSMRSQNGIRETRRIEFGFVGVDRPGGTSDAPSEDDEGRRAG